MIRINLLPITEERRNQQGRTQLAVFAAIIFVCLAAMGIVYYMKAQNLDRLKKEVSSVTRQVEENKRKLAAVEETKRQTQSLQKQLDVLNTLESQRTGPVKVLDDMQALLSSAASDGAKAEQRRVNWNSEWDPRRLWIETLTESDQSFVVTGGAMNAEDVAEFLKRLTSSEHFQNVQLDFVEAKTEKVKQARSQRELRYVQYRVTGDLSYDGKPVKRVASKTKKRGRN